MQPSVEQRRFTALARWWVDGAVAADPDGPITTENAAETLRKALDLLAEASVALGADPAYAIEQLNRALEPFGPLDHFQHPALWRLQGGQALAEGIEFADIQYADLIDALAAHPEVREPVVDLADPAAGVAGAGGAGGGPDAASAGRRRRIPVGGREAPAVRE